jgi:hypothetical protein
MTVIAVGTAVLMWTLEGTHMITFSSVMFMVVMIFAGVLIDIVMVFGPPENDPGVDRLLRYRPKRPPGAERDLRRSRIYRPLDSLPMRVPESPQERES